MENEVIFGADMTKLSGRIADRWEIDRLKSQLSSAIIVGAVGWIMALVGWLVAGLMK